MARGYWAGDGRQAKPVVPQGSCPRRCCEDGRVSLTPGEPRAPRWQPFKEQLISQVPGGRWSRPLPLWTDCQLSGGGSCSESWKLLICVSAELARRGPHAGCLAAAWSHGDTTARGGRGSVQALPGRGRLRWQRRGQSRDLPASPWGADSTCTRRVRPRGGSGSQISSPIGLPQGRAGHPAATGGLQLIEGLGRSPGHYRKPVISQR